MSVRPDTVLNQDSLIIFRGPTEQVVHWIEKLYDEAYGPLWVSIGENGAIMSASEYLDLAT